MLDRADIAWAAGLFEGEGHFGIHSGHGQRSATLQMTDEDTVRKFHEVVGFGRVRGPMLPYQTARKTTWRWEATSYQHVQAFIAMAWPWLRNRRKARARELLSIRGGPGQGHRTDIHMEVHAGGPC